MPTLSDLIQFALSIDGTAVVTGGQQASAEIERTKRTLEQQGADLERIAKNVGYGLETVVQGVASFFGLVLSFEGFKNLVTGAAQAGTTMGRFAESIDKTVEQTQAYKQAFDSFQGGASGILDTIRQMKLDLTALNSSAATGSVQYAEWMKRVELLTKKTVLGKEPEEILKDISEAAKQRHLTPAQTTTFLQGSLPLSAADITLLSKPGELERLLKKQREEIGVPTSKQAEAMEKLREGMTNLETASQLLKLQAATLLEPFLSKLLTWTTDALNWLRSVAEMLGFTQKMTSPTTAVLIPSAGASSKFTTEEGRAPGGVTVRPVPRAAPEPSPLRTGAGTTFSPKTGQFESAPVTRPAPASREPAPPTPPPVTGEAPAVPEGSVGAVGGGPPAAFIVHHTSGRGTVSGVQETLRERGLGVQYVMDREGNIIQIGGPGSSHMRTGWGAGEGLSNRNTVGMEVIAKDDKDVTPAQVEAAKRFIAERYPNTPVYGHGEVNPGHKEADEGMTIVGAIRRERAAKASPTTAGSSPPPSAVKGSTFDDVRTASGRSASTTSGIALPEGQGKLGDLYEITTPDGRKFIAPLIDRGPAKWTGRGVDVSAPLAKEMGYSQKGFPTDSSFQVRPYTPPAAPPPAATPTTIPAPAALLPIPARETLQPILMPNMPTGAAAAAQSFEDNRPKIENHDISAHVNHIDVHTHAVDATAIAQDVKDAIGKQLEAPVAAPSAAPGGGE